MREELPPFTSEAAVELHGPEWLRDARRQAAGRFGAAALPTTSLEEWRYSRIDALDLGRYAPSTVPPAAPAPDADLDALVGALGPATVIETHDGWLSVSRADDPAVTVEVLSRPDAGPAEVGAIAGEPDAFTTLNLAFAPDPLRVVVRRGATPAPIVVVHRSTTADVAVFPRVLVDAGEDSEVRVVEIVTGDAPALVVPVTELEVGPAARVSYLQVQTLDPAAWQLGLQASRVARDATLVSAAVALGGEYARLRTDSALTGPGGSTRLLALYFGVGEQMHDFRTVQDHRSPKTRSDLLYKGVVANQSRSVYTGLIRVEKGAHGTNAFQTNRNLVLHEGAHADSVPNLEIEDNDVRCSHASAVGPVSEDQRFYLESRGVPPAVTERLIALGFLAEVVEQLPMPAARPQIALALAARLADAERIEEGRRGHG